jgi:hypothetical protein
MWPYKPARTTSPQPSHPTLQMRVSFTDRATGRRISLLVSDPKQLHAIAERAK